MSLSASTVDKLMRLSALSLDAEARAELHADLDKIIELIDAMQRVDTDGVAPLAQPLDGTQPLRPDRVTEVVDREQYQRTAPQTRDGLYIVPRVVE